MRDDSVGLAVTIVFAIIFMALFDVAKGAEAPDAPLIAPAHR